MNIDITDEDRVTIGAILATHAEMQDHRTVPSMEMRARLVRDEPEEVEMIEDLDDQIEVFEEDSINLRRLARKFGTDV